MTIDFDIKPLLSRTERFIQTLHYAAMNLQIKPDREHIVTCINYKGLLQMRKEFLTQLTNSVVNYVYSSSKQKEIVSELTGGDIPLDETSAHIELFQQSAKYFRPSDIKGQFSELLLFNFLQHHFQALPVVRKMTITTNPKLERNGADAIHLGRNDNGSFTIYLGEAKTYTSGFKAAFKQAVKSIVTAYNEHRNELQLYQYEAFLEDNVKSLVKSYLQGSTDLPVKLVIIICYCSNKTPEKQSELEYLEHYIQDIMSECKKIVDTDYSNINPGLLAEIHYLMFPVNELNELLRDFKLKLGLK